VRKRKNRRHDITDHHVVTDNAAAVIAVLISAPFTRSRREELGSRFKLVQACSSDVASLFFRPRGIDPISIGRAASPPGSSRRSSTVRATSEQVSTFVLRVPPARDAARKSEVKTDAGGESGGLFRIHRVPRPRSTRPESEKNLLPSSKVFALRALPEGACLFAGETTRGHQTWTPVKLASFDQVRASCWWRRFTNHTEDSRNLTVREARLTRA